MKWVLISLVVIIITLGAFYATLEMWPDPVHAHKATPEQFPYFLLLSFIESFALGLGVVLFFMGWPLIGAVPYNYKVRVIVSFLILIWGLVSWWPHDMAHRSIDASNLQDLIYIEYGFHVSLLIGVLFITYSFFSISKEALTKRYA